MASSWAAADLAPGDRVGDYIVQSPVAAGGFGSVYRVEHRENQSTAALKVLHAELTSTPSAVLRFEREIEVIRRIRHPNVVDIHESGRLDDGRPYFVMELLSGMNLEAFMRVRKRLPPAEVLTILEPLCEALATCHAEGVIHRDLKASNIFLGEDRGVRRVILLDFGVAKLLDASAPGLTAPSNIVGTPSCMAPEQIRSEPATARTDVYALGVLSYFMLTGELPFHDPSFLLMQSMHLYVSPAKPSTVAPVGAAFDEVVLRAMSKSPAKRYASTLEFLAGFRAAVETAAAPGSVRSADDRRVLALHIEVRVNPDALDEPDEALFADIEAILPFASRAMEDGGFTVAVRTGNTMLLGAELPKGAEAERSRRREAVLAVLALRREIGRRPTLDARVHVNICLHVGTSGSPGGSLIDGELLDLSTWIPEESVDGVVGSAPVLEDLDLAARPLGDSCMLLRVLDPTL